MNQINKIWVSKRTPPSWRVAKERDSWMKRPRRLKLSQSQTAPKPRSSASTNRRPPNAEIAQMPALAEHFKWREKTERSKMAYRPHLAPLQKINQTKKPPTHTSRWFLKFTQNRPHYSNKVYYHNEMGRLCVRAPELCAYSPSALSASLMAWSKRPCQCSRCSLPFKVGSSMNSRRFFPPPMPKSTLPSSPLSEKVSRAS